MKNILFLLLVISGFLVWGLALADATTSTQSAIFKITGKVKIQSADGTKTRVAQQGSTVVEGESIITGKNSTATLDLFDGSQMQISSSTKFQLIKLQKPSTQDKVLQFKLFVGKLFATVKKLASSKSSFEIEGGGVVCGVRGTEFTMQYDPETGKVNVQVLDGTVWAQGNGNTFTYGAGQGGNFTNGNPDTAPSNSNNQGGGNQGKGGGNNFNPFYGFNGNPAGDSQNSLTNLPGGVGGTVDGLGTDGRSTVTTQNSVVLQLGFPEYK